MKIIVIGTRGFPDVQGGVESHCENLYTFLAKKGCDITVFTRMAYTGPGERIYKGINLVPLSCPRNRFLETIVHTFKATLKARKLRPDILHIHAIGPALFTPFARILGMKVLVTSHGPDYERKKWSFSAKIFLRFCECMGMTFANRIITIANNISEDIKHKYDRDAVVIPNGVNIPQLQNAGIALEKFEVQEKKYILTVGRFVPEKGFHDLIEAFNIGNFSDYKLVIVGDADHEDKYSRKLKDMARNNSKIVLTGRLMGNALKELYSHARLFVLPSYYEGLPIVLLEAMSYGLSCVASDIAANRNVELGKDRFFKVGDIKLLSEKMNDLINEIWNEDKRNRQLELIAEKYSWPIIADDTLSVYEELLCQKDSSSK